MDGSNKVPYQSKWLDDDIPKYAAPYNRRDDKIDKCSDVIVPLKPNYAVQYWSKDEGSQR